MFISKREGIGRTSAVTVAAMGDVVALRKVKGIIDVVEQLLVQPLLRRADLRVT